LVKIRGAGRQIPGQFFSLFVPAYSEPSESFINLPAEVDNKKFALILLALASSEC
jgi:hypothetical protein